MGCCSSLKRGVVVGMGYVFEYPTPAVVLINSKKVGMISRLMQLIIIGYIIGWVMVYKKGYQETDSVVSGVVSKVKGVSFTNVSGAGPRIWDTAEIVEPPQEKDAFFVTTSAFFTHRQKQETCPEDPGVPKATCEDDEDCVAGEQSNLGNGMRTGRCVNTTTDDGIPTKTCEVFAWCPVERENTPAYKLNTVPSFTVLIKNSIEFPKFKTKRFNVLPSYNDSTLKTCSYDPVSDRFCPVFKIGTMLNITDTKFEDIASKGGVIAFSIAWDCDLDLSPEKCLPVYSFRRLDLNDTFAKGWNFRKAQHYYVNDTEYRDLIKLYGIRVIIYVSGTAGQFRIIPLTMNLGSGLALLGLATVLCDMIVLYVLNKRNHYYDAKYKTIQGDDAYKILEESSRVDMTTPGSSSNNY